jgi:hypothetical protein
MVPDWVAESVGAQEWEALAGGYTRALKWRAIGRKHGSGIRGST